MPFGGSWCQEWLFHRLFKRLFFIVSLSYGLFSLGARYTTEIQVLQINGFYLPLILDPTFSIFSLLRAPLLPISGKLLSCSYTCSRVFLFLFINFINEDCIKEGLCLASSEFLIYRHRNMIKDISEWITFWLLRSVFLNDYRFMTALTLVTLFLPSLLTQTVRPNIVKTEQLVHPC